MNDYKALTKCLCCDSKELTPYLDLGNQPLANSYHDGSRKQDRYPLGVQFCKRCSHSQLTHKVDNRLMFDDYLYVSGTSDTLRNYFGNFARLVLKNWKGKSPPRVLEIACNDGTLLQILKSKGCEVLGVDPALNLVELCKQENIPVWPDYWDEDVAKKLIELHGRFDIVIAINVLPHVPNPQEFMRACRLVLDSSTKGSGIYVQTSQCDMFKNGEFDAIYHEHHSYFTASSFGTLAYGAGLEIVDVKKIPIHSMSFLFQIGKMSGTGHCDKLFSLLEEENAAGWHDLETYKAWGAETYSKRAAFKALLETYRKNGYRLVGYGASAKANTVLNFFDLSLDFIVDDNPLKWGLLTPGRDIPIISPDADVIKGTYVTWVMTAWNFQEEILNKIRETRKWYSWPEFVLSYIPKVDVEALFSYGRCETEDNLSGY